MSEAAASAPSPSASTPAPAGSGGSPSERVAAAQKTAQAVTLPGQQGRAASRAKALGSIDRHEMQRMLAEKRGQAAEAPQVTRVRDMNGRFVGTKTVAAKAETPDVQPVEAPAAPSEEQAPAAPEAPAVPAPTAPDPEVVQLKAAVQQATEREQHLARGAAEAAEKIADVSDERDHYKQLFTNLTKALEARGLALDPGDLRNADLSLQLRRAQRQQTRVQSHQQTEQVTRQAATISAAARAQISAHPELDPKTNPEAHAFWEWWLGANAPLDHLERDAKAWAMTYRGRQAQALAASQAAAQPPKPVATARPESVIPRGQSGTEGTSPAATSGRRGEHVSKKSIAQEMTKFRALRGGRA